jgi:hypothetical protein
MKALALFAALGILCCLPSGCSQSDSASSNPPKSSYRVAPFVFSANGRSQKITGALVTPAFFQTAKARPSFGRAFLPEEYKSGGQQVVVIGGRFWNEQLGADPRRIGTTIHLNDKTFTIVGIVTSTFEIPSGADLWVPDTDSAQSQERRH